MGLVATCLLNKFALNVIAMITVRIISRYFPVGESTIYVVV